MLLCSLFYTAASYSQCESEVKYEQAICKLDGTIKAAYDTLSIRSEYEKLISAAKKRLNLVNCDKIERLIDELGNELKHKYEKPDFTYNELVKTFLNSLKIYVSSLKDVTSKQNFSLYDDQRCISNYQQSELAKGQLLNYIHFLDAQPPVVKDTASKYHFTFSFGNYSSSIQKEFEKTILTGKDTNLSFKKWNYDINFDYSIAKNIRVGIGVNSVPETGVNYLIDSGRVEERVSGTTVKLRGTYLLYPYKNNGKLGIEAGISLALTGSFISTQTSIVKLQRLDIINETDLLLIEQELYFGKTTSLGGAVSGFAELYFNKYISLHAAVTGNINENIRIPVIHYNITKSLPERSLKFTALSIQGGIVIHL
jgi:hypothetical protein